MSAFSKKRGIFISILIALIIWISLNFILLKSQEAHENNQEYSSAEEQNLDGITINPNLSGDWKIYIPKTNVTINLDEGDKTKWDSEGMHHYAYSPELEGNVQILDYQPYKHNTFEILNKLEIGDILEYEKDGIKRLYKIIVKTNKDFDSYLKDTEDDRLTIFTLTMYEPEDSLCIQAILTK